MSNFRMTIGRRIGLGYSVLILFIVVIFTLTYWRVNDAKQAFEESKAISNKITNTYEPSLRVISALHENIKLSRNLIEIWVERGVRRDEPNKASLLQLMNDKIPNEDTTIVMELMHDWDNETEKNLALKIDSNVRLLIGHYRLITDDLLYEPIDYQDPESGTSSLNLMLATDVISPGGDMDITCKKALTDLKDLETRMARHNRTAVRSKDEKLKNTTEAFTGMLWLIAFLGGMLIFGATLVATFTTRSIVRPVNQLRSLLTKMGMGIIPDEKMKTTNDEIGDMALALNKLVDGFRRTTEFSNQVGSGNFDYEFQPLSSEDMLGHALLKMRDDLAENERILEQKVVERTEEVVRQRDEIERQRLKVEELYKDVTDSIRYAKRLQDSILPPENYINSLLPESFVLFQPKDIVSGDFYWVEKSNDKVLFAAVDCTGHGVPGAFMSLVGANALNQAVRENQLDQPALILDDLNRIASDSLNKQSEDNTVRDGMDVALCGIDFDNKTLEYAGANNPLYIIRNDEIMITKADKVAIGSTYTDHKYTNHTIQLEEGDSIYVFSDGYADQFGGSKGKKFMYRQFRDVLKSMKGKNMAEQKVILEQKLEEWKGKYEQVDDILVIGVKL